MQDTPGIRYVSVSVNESYSALVFHSAFINSEHYFAWFVRVIAFKLATSTSLRYVFDLSFSILRSFCCFYYTYMIIR